jgi:transmembrane sensor
MTTPRAVAAADPVLAAAVAWAVRLRSGDATDADHRAVARWRTADARHEQAWQRIEAVGHTLRSVPAELAHATLEARGGASTAAAHARGTVPARRAALKSFALVAGLGAGAWAATRVEPARGWLAAATHDVHTRVGERREIALADGTALALDTDTAVDVAITPQARHVTLARGEIVVETGHAHPAPLEVRVGRVSLHPLGTRFRVRFEDAGPGGAAESAGAVRVDVFEGRVAVRTDGGAGPVVEAGAAARVDRDGRVTGLVADIDAIAWTDGVVVAKDRPLGELVATLARYRPGWTGCDPGVAALRVSGVFPVDDTDRALDALAHALPVRIERRTRWWTRVTAAR